MSPRTPMSMSFLAGCALLLSLPAGPIPCHAQDSASIPTLEEANAAYEARDLDRALSLFQKIVAGEKDASTRAKATFNLGMTYAALQRYGEAIAAYDKIFDMEVDDSEAGGHLMETCRNYRPRARWETGNCHFRQGKYEEALAAYLDVKTKYQFQTWCGNERHENRVRYALWTGVCLEHLGRHAEAVRAYYGGLDAFLGGSSRLGARIAQLYVAAGKGDVLKRLVEEMDAEAVIRFADEKRRQGEKEPPELDSKIVKDLSGTWGIDGYLKLLDMEAKRDWQGLIGVLAGDHNGGGPEEGVPWEQKESARLLALHPSETVPLLIEGLRRLRTTWIAYGLGTCGTPEALEAIRAEMKRDDYFGNQPGFIYAISMAGEAGRNLLDRIEKKATGNARIAMERFRKHQYPFSDPVEKIVFPAIPSGATLPLQLSEIDDWVAFRERRPRTVTLDLSSPEKAVDTYLKSMIVGDRAVFVQSIAKSETLLSTFDAFVERDWNWRFVYSIGETRMIDGDEAEVDATLTCKEREEGRDSLAKVLVKLEKTGDEWRVSSVANSR